MERRWKIKENMRKNLTDIFYIEWKYFSFIQKDVSAIFSYSIGDPRNLSRRGEGLIFVRVYLDKQTIGETLKIPLPNCNFSDLDSTASFGDHGILTKDENILRIYGKTEQMSWDLTYSSNEKVLSQRRKIKSLILKNSFLEWDIYMPYALVTGEITLPLLNKTFKIDTIGYHDGNLGKFIPWGPMWNWFQMTSMNKEKKFCIVFGDIWNARQGGVVVFREMDRIFFNRGECNYRPLKQDRRSFEKFKGMSTLNAENEVYILKLRLKELRSDKLRVKMPLILPNLLIHEGLAMIDGTLFKKEKGSLIPIEEMHELGFKEYTTREWFWMKD